MTLSSALNTAVSGLTAQSTALATISKNIANASTTAYKTSGIDFQTLVTGASDEASTDGGVLASTFQTTGQGQIASSAVSTNLAINGSGFFVVAGNTSDSSSAFDYTRDGSFAADDAGNLVNDAGYYLEGFPTDAQGNVLASNTNDLSNLKPVNLSNIGGTAKATTTIAMTANLPANAAVGASFPTSTTAVDSLGVSHTIGETWTKTAANTWTVTLANPKLTSNPTGPDSGVISPASFNVSFDTSGVLSSVSPSPATIALTGLTTGAADSSIAMNLGAVGKTDGLTQYSSTSDTPAIENPTFTQDGALFGQLKGVTIDNNGLVTAAFDNGVKMAIYKIPVATFANPAGLSVVEGTVYGDNQAAGSVSLKLPGSSSAGTLESSALEGSTTDIATEFNKMIVAQQAYSAASQLVSTVKTMFDTLTQAVR